MIENIDVDKFIKKLNLQKIFKNFFPYVEASLVKVLKKV
jgi:hypothetical protein|tara:strand:+ start:255 stop:371 length:117 start_codon:yes stop_codon:yes gene_type:complete